MPRDVRTIERQVSRRPRDVFLATLAIAVAILGCFGYFAPVCVGGMIGDYHWLGLHFYDGRFRVFFFESPQVPVRIWHSGRYVRFGSRAANPFSVDVPFTDRVVHWGPARWRAHISVGDRRAVPSFGGAWRERLGWNGMRASRRRALPGRPAVAVPLSTRLLRALGDTSSVRCTYIRLPFVIPVALLLIVPLRASMGAIRFRFRSRKNLCVACGYDLRGTPAMRCPECGTQLATG